MLLTAPHIKSRQRIRGALRRMALAEKGESTRECVSARFSIVSLFAGCGGMDLGFRGGFDFLGKHFSHIWSLAKVSGEQGNRRMVADRPGYTIRAECHGNIQFHYSLPRRISMREAARIQSFPDSFAFMSKLRATERQVGNAVPPVLAWHVARSVETVLFCSNNVKKGRGQQ